MSKRGTFASGYQASREKYKYPVKECQKSELRGDDIPLGQVSGITSILEVEQSIDFVRGRFTGLWPTLDQPLQLKFYGFLNSCSQ